MKFKILFIVALFELSACQVVTPPEDLGEQTIQAGPNKVSKERYNQYAQSLYNHLKTHLAPNAFDFNDKTKKASVRIRFDEQGRLIENKLIASSGDTIFDNKAVALAQASAPLPAPPADLVPLFKEQGILLRFP